MSATRLITLRVQLLKEHITEFNDALSERARERCRTYGLRDDLPFEGGLFIAEPSDNPPPWFEFTNEELVDPLEHLRNKNNAAALLIHRQNRIFVFCSDLDSTLFTNRYPPQK